MDTRKDTENKKRSVSFDLPGAPYTAEPIAICQDENDDYDPLSNCMFVKINSEPPPVNPQPVKHRPVKHRPKSTYITREKLNSSRKGLHNISLVTKAPNSRDSFFYKEIPQHSPYMPELESYSWGCYHLLTPRYVPASTRPIYDISKGDDCYVGVSSKEIPGFKPAKDVQLQKKDLQLAILDQGVTIEKMEEIDQLSLKDTYFDTIDGKDTLTKVWVNDRSVIVTVDDLKHYRIARGLGCGMTASYVYKDDDVHRDNMSKQGDRIDFDMSNWSILSLFKSSSLLDGLVRYCNLDTRFSVHADDIRNFPELTHASPYYWPTIASNKVVLAASTNPWNAEESAIYKTLSTNPVFNHFKYQTLLKFILTSADHYRAIAEAHIRPELRYKNKSIIDMLVEDQKARIKLISDTLMNMPEFTDFIKNNGDFAFKTIRAEFEASNQRYRDKIAKTDTMLLTLEKNNPQDIAAFAEKFNIPNQNITDHNSMIKIKENILKALTMKKEAYLKQMIDINKLTADFTALKKPHEQQTEIKQLQKQMQAEATAAVSTVLYPTPSIK